MQPRLRLFAPDSAAESADPSRVAVPLQAILEPLRQALLADSTFLADFGDDEIELSADLYDVLMCFQRHQVRA